MSFLVATTGLKHKREKENRDYICNGKLNLSRLCRLLFAPVAFQSLDRACVDPFEQKQQLRPFKLDRLVRSIDEADFREAKGTDLKPLSEDGKAIDIPPQNFDEVAASTVEEKNRVREGVLFEMAPHQTIQTIERFPHIDWFGANEYASRRRKGEHHNLLAKTRKMSLKRRSSLPDTACATAIIGTA
ncbi:MAG: hypothetical protein ACRDOH_36215 [Streptosporangiaceae bacterium]